MSAADWWRVGYGHDFAQHIGRIADALEDIYKVLAAIEQKLTTEPKGEEDEGR